MNPDYVEIIRANSHPLRPLPTGMPPRLEAFPAVRAVIFDIYGTMLISASGDVGSAEPGRKTRAVVAALAAAGLTLADDAGTAAADCLVGAIQKAHRRVRARGIDHPEVDIREVWAVAIDELVRRGLLPAHATHADMAALAVHHEVLANPVWPMPGLLRCLAALPRAGCLLGIVSNAQFYTPLLFPALLDRTLEQLGFDPGLLAFSYRLRAAKPGCRLFRTVAEALFSRGLSSNEVLYIGNDMLNDVVGARQVGWRTALFAADRRSLRLRASDLRVDGVEPDVVLTQLNQIVDCSHREVVGPENEYGNG